MVKVAMVTPWGKRVRWGIRTYSEGLIGSLAELGVDVYVIRFPRFGIKTPDIMKLVTDSIPDEVDLVHVQQEYGLYRGLEGAFYGVEGLKRLGKPVVTTMHSVGNFEVDPVVCQNSDVVVVHNEYCSRRLDHPNVIIPHGCGGPFKCPPEDECKKVLGIDPRAPLVGYVGFISAYKGLEWVVEAMTKVPDAGLLIGGGWHTAGAETRYIEKLKQDSLMRLPGRCQWLGYVPDDRLSTVYGAMRIVVYPSKMITESGALLMALSHGKAVIASDLRAVREKRKLGALMTFKSVADLRRKIKRLLKDDEARRELEEGARHYAESVSWSEIARRHISLYEDVVGLGAEGGLG